MPTIQVGPRTIEGVYNDVVNVTVGHWDSAPTREGLRYKVYCRIEDNSGNYFYDLRFSNEDALAFARLLHSEAVQAERGL